jgi:hypothetical protein
VTAALASHVDRLDLPAEPGVSQRAVRSVLKMMAKIANDGGEFRYGLRGSKLANLTDYSLSVVRRAQHYLVDLGYLERVKVGGGRASTKWRIAVDKIASNLGSRHTSSDTPAQQPDRHDTAQGPSPKSYLEMYRAAQRQKNGPSGAVQDVLERPLCDHGFAAGLLPSGKPRCPMCRRQPLMRRRT